MSRRLRPLLFPPPFRLALAPLLEEGLAGPLFAVLDPPLGFAFGLGRDFTKSLSSFHGSNKILRFMEAGFFFSTAAWSLPRPSDLEEIDHKSTKVLMADAAAAFRMQEEKGAPQDEDSILSELKEVQTEYSQLSELEEMERDYAMKLVNALKEVQSEVDVIIPLERAALGPAYRYAKEAYLGGDAVVILLNNLGISSAIPLAKFKSGEILSIDHSATPHLKKAIAAKRRETAERLEIIDMILKEMKKAGSSVKLQSPDDYQAPVEEDLVSSSIASL